MRDPFAGYDAWLERPHQDMMDESDRFLEWAEANDYDLDDPGEVAEAEYDYQEYLASQGEDEAEARYEAYLDRLEMEAEDREYEDWG